MRISDLAPAKGAKKNRKRLGRGVGSGTGKTSGKGTKGHKARSGYKHRPWFEGGQMPLQRRLPKIGFTNIFRTGYLVVNLDRLNQFEDGAEVTPQLLYEKRVTRKKDQPVKILAGGKLEKKLTVKVHGASAKAQEAIAAAGGAFEPIEA
jgi:large subunit ribosomal protein L15